MHTSFERGLSGKRILIDVARSKAGNAFNSLRRFRRYCGARGFFLFSDDGAWINGQVLHVNGGALMP